ncbi:MAG: transglutaminase family protein, partial [Methylobacterium sp.]
MKIRTGFDIAFDSAQPTPMILMLSIHPSRLPDLMTPQAISFDPPIPCHQYEDGFGNLCHRIVTPTGPLTISADFTVQDSGLPDAYAPGARQFAVQDLPDEVLVY